MTIQDLINEAKKQPKMTAAEKERALKWQEQTYGKADKIDRQLYISRQNKS